MNDLRLSPSHDIFLSGDRIARFPKSGDRAAAASVGQAALCMARTEEGEAFADPGEGIPWFRSILGLPESHLDVALRIVREKLEAVPGVSECVRLELSAGRGSRSVSGRFTVRAGGAQDTEVF